MIHWFNNLPLRGKIMMIVLSTISVVLIITFLSFVLYESSRSWQEDREKLKALAKIAGLNSTAALSFNDPASATDTLSALSAEPNIIAAYLLTNEDQVFARYHTKDVNEQRTRLLSRLPKDLILEFGSESLWNLESDMEVMEPIVLKGQTIGRVLIQADTSGLFMKFRLMLLFAAIMLAVVFLVAYVMSSRLQRVISEPILHLVETMRTISEKKNYEVRVKRENNDEVGLLFDGFNVMLEHVQTRDKQLEQHQANLELQVAMRTKELSAANEKLESMIGELKSAKEAAEAASKAKSAFLANMSHEIRTPLHGVLGMTEMLHRTELSEQQRRYVDSVQASGELLKGIVTEILDFSKIESGKIELEHIDVDLRRIMAGMLPSFTLQAREKGLDFDAGIDVADDLVVTGDPTRFRQVFTNLISNAVKFTETGTISVRLQLDDNRDGSAAQSMVVADTGIGMTAEERQRIFESFSQADGSTTRKYGGTGLGLAITKKIVTLMGGSIRVESEPGKGSTFRVAIQCPIRNRESSREGSKAVGGTLKKGNPAGTRILVAEDNVMNQEVVRGMLEALNYTVDIAPNGKEAVKAASESFYDLIFMDCQMPEMDGFEATRCIRDQERAIGKRTRIVALTGNVVKEDLDKCLAHGMDDFLGKPFTLEKLGAMLSKWLVSHGEQTERPSV